MSDGKNLSVGYDGHLHIDKVTKVDDSEFKCVAENKAGRSERTVKFNVLSKPEIFDTRNGTASVGGSGLIECFVRGNPLPKVYIRFEKNVFLFENVFACKQSLGYLSYI